MARGRTKYNTRAKHTNASVPSNNVKKGAPDSDVKAANDGPAVKKSTLDGDAPDGVKNKAPDGDAGVKKGAPDSDVKAANDGPGGKNADAKKKAAVAASVGGLGALAGLAAIFSGNAREECVKEWMKQHPGLWQGEEQRTLVWLLEKTKTGDAEADAKHQKAYEALYECKGRDFFGNTIAGLGKTLVSPLAGVFGDSLGQLVGPIANALAPVKWVLVALLCALVAGAAYKAYMAFLARRALPGLEAPTTTTPGPIGLAS
jgi:hypothetical protein